MLLQSAVTGLSIDQCWLPAQKRGAWARGTSRHFVWFERRIMRSLFGGLCEHWWLENEDKRTFVWPTTRSADQVDESPQVAVICVRFQRLVLMVRVDDYVILFNRWFAYFICIFIQSSLSIWREYYMNVINCCHLKINIDYEHIYNRGMQIIVRVQLQS